MDSTLRNCPMFNAPPGKYPLERLPLSNAPQSKVLLLHQNGESSAFKSWAKTSSKLLPATLRCKATRSNLELGPVSHDSWIYNSITKLIRDISCYLLHCVLHYGCGSYLNGIPKWLALGSGTLETKTCGLPLLFKFEPQP